MTAPDGTTMWKREEGLRAPAGVVVISSDAATWPRLLCSSLGQRLHSSLAAAWHLQPTEHMPVVLHQVYMEHQV